MSIRRVLMTAAVGTAISAAPTAPAGARTELAAYTDAKGFLDVEAVTCAQLADSCQEDADILAAWYSGRTAAWTRSIAHIVRAKAGEHALTVSCKADRDRKIIQALDVLFKDGKAQQGTK